MPPGAKRVFTTISGVPVEPLYRPEQIQGIDPAPGSGEFPYTRGIHETMYRGKLWTMRQFSGFATVGCPKPATASRCSLPTECSGRFQTRRALGWDIAGETRSTDQQHRDGDEDRRVACPDSIQEVRKRKRPGQK
jgi:methylmalonyl-CoA mutase N-terminal domain/subunit